jgi:hypothetical protein
LKRKIIITYNSYDRSIRTAKILRTKLASAGFEVLEKPDPEAELFIAIGGDGSFFKKHFTIMIFQRYRLSV